MHTQTQFIGVSSCHISRQYKTEQVHTTPIASNSRSHVDELRPPIWRQRFLSQLLNCAVKRVGDRACIDGFVRHQFFVEPLRQVWAVGVVHHPVFTISSLSSR
jgi:hypothetical protein